MKEKQIENSINSYLLSIWAVVEKMQSWKVLIKKWGYNNMMTLQTKGCPDLMCFHKWEFYWIEVKKNEEEVNKWLKIKDRHYWIGKTLVGLTSYTREIDQIEYRQKILNNNGTFILTCSLNEVKSIIY